MFQRPNTATLAAAGVILAMFFAFAGDGIHGFFAPDEMMNLYAAWSPTAALLARTQRPLGSFVYRALFDLFGLNPMPYRLLCFVLLLSNLWLLYIFCSQLATREIAALACLLGAYHARLADLYYTSSDIFDLLCFFFSYLALVYYFAIRRRGFDPDLRQSALLLTLYLCALGSKEMGVLWPVAAVLYELIYHRKDLAPGRLRERLSRLAGLWAGVLAVTIPYVALKTAGAHRMTSNPDYQLHLTLPDFFGGWRHYLGHLFYSNAGLTDFQIVALFASMLAVAWLTSRRELLFAWFVIGIGSLPFLFLNHRGFFVAYLTLPGWYLYAAGVLVWLGDTLLRPLPQPARVFAMRWRPVALFGLLAVWLIPQHWREKPVAAAVITSDYQVHQKLMGQLASRYPKLPRGARVLFLSDPYPADDYILQFIFALQYRDRDIRVDRAKVDPQLSAHGAGGDYDHVFAWSGAGLEEVTAAR